jgi:hypothetical protein
MMGLEPTTFCMAKDSGRHDKEPTETDKRPDHAEVDRPLATRIVSNRQPDLTENLTKRPC